jgi:hypothetical protein
MLTYPNIRYSERDCSGNPAKHHKMKKITITRQIQNGAMQIGTESPFQHHLIFYILLLNFIKQIQMVLDSPNHLTEESSSYNSERSDCLNHGFSPLTEVSSSYRQKESPPSTRLWQLQRFSILDTKFELLPLTRLWHSQLASGRGEGNNSNTAEKVVL